MSGKINENLLLTSVKFIKHKEYWLGKLSGEMAETTLFADNEIKPNICKNISTLEIPFPHHLCRSAIKMGKQSDIAIYIILLAVLKSLIYRCTGNEDITVISPLYQANVTDKTMNDYVFIRDSINENTTSRDLLLQLKQTVLDAYAHQDYPSDRLAKTLFKTSTTQENTRISNVVCAFNGLHAIGKRKPEKEKDKIIFTFVRKGDGLEGHITYNPGIYAENVYYINQIPYHFIAILESLIEEINRKILQIPILSAGEKKQLLDVFNGVESAYPVDKTLDQLFAEQAERTPDQIAILGLCLGREDTFDPKKNLPCISYKELNRQSHQLAQVLLAKGVQPDSFVGLLVDRTLEMIIGLLAILKAGAAYLPMDPDYPPERIAYMLKDSSAKILLASPGTRGMVKAEVTGGYFEIIDISNLSFFSIDTLNSTTRLTASADRLAYLIYTSGSTSRPKGVMIQHSSVVNLVLCQVKHFQIKEKERILLFSSISFDASVEQVFIALLSGAALVVVDIDSLLDQEKFETLISCYCITHLDTVPSFLKTLHMKSNYQLKRVIAGGDICPVSLARKWYQLCSFYNVYGPTETTISSIEMLVENISDSMTQLPIGKPLDNTKIYILDCREKPVPLGVKGQLYIGGEGLARGYLNQVELTAEKFKINTFPGGGRFYQTGDLARWVADGNIEFMGRIDYQVKIRGNRIEIGEIENRLLKRSDIKEVVVLARPDEMGDNYLCAYIVSNRKVTVLELREYLAHHLPDYMIPSFFVLLEKMPLTSTGKVNRNTLPVPKIETGETYVAPRNQIEEKLVMIWSKALARDALHASQLRTTISIDDNFFELGGHSLKATILASGIHKEFDVKVPLKAIFNIPTIRGFAGHIAKSVPDRFANIEAVEKKEYYPLSSAQKRQYILQQVELETTLYNMPVVIPLAQQPDIEKLQNTFKQLINRHESLRTSFHMKEDEPVQQVHDDIDIKIEYFDLKINRLEVKVELEDGDEEGTRGLAPLSNDPAVRNPQPVTALISSFIRSFDLSQAPLLRVGLIKPPHTPSALRGHPSQEGRENKYLLIVDMHHIISDGASEDTLAAEIIALHDREKLPPLRIQYKDFAEWQNSEKEKKNIKKQEAYWLGQFGDEIPVLNIPTDFTRPMIQDFSGNIVTFEMSPRHTRQLKTMALQEKTTLYMMVLAVLNVLLSKLCNQEDIVVGTPIEGRRHTDLEKIIGMFVNTLALRNQPLGRKTFRQFLTEVKEKTLEAYENQDYPFEDLVDKLLVNRDPGRNPLFDVMYTLQSMDKDAGRDAQKQKRSMDQPREDNKNIMHISKFDMIFGGVEAGEKLFFVVEYCTKLFKKETIEQFNDYFKQTAAAVVDGGMDKKILEMEIISKSQKKRLLFDFNNTQTDYPGAMTIHELFENQVERTPDHTALVGVHETHETHETHKKNDNMSHMSYMSYLSYKELNEKSEQLAYILMEKGVQPDTIVGIMMDRSIEMLIAILAILKASGSYLPIETGYPQERIKFMLKDSGTKILVTSPALAEKFKKLSIVDCQLLMVNEKFSARRRLNIPPKEANSINNYQLTIHNSQLNSSNLAYIIYTSGTTGKPKGVMTNHYNVTRVVKNTNYIDIKEQDRILQLSNYAFDGSVFDIYGALLNGAALVLVSQEQVLAVDQLAAVIKREQVTIFFVTTALFNTLVDLEIDCFANVNKVLFGGERVSVEHSRQARQYMGKGRILHVYGPTETTVYASYYFIDTIDETAVTIPIGKPLANTAIYILNQYLKPTPLGVSGEVYIGGKGTARGYLNRPDLTAEKFIKNPFINRDILYRTGDLARWLPEGAVEFLGRIDQQLKIRGFRIELGEIETQLLNHPGIKEVAVMAMGEVTVDQCLCAYIITKRTPDISELRKYLSLFLPDYMIPDYFVFLEKIPLTPNGKIDRKALPTPVLKSDARYCTPRNSLEEKLAEIWFDVLAAPGAAAGHLLIGIDDDFFELGGHSLKATVMVDKIHKALNVKVPLAEVFRTPTIRELAAYIKGAEEEKHASIKPVEKKEYYASSSSQKRLYILQHMEPGGMAYNMPEIIPLSGKTGAAKLQETFKKLIARHESLRTSFHMVEDEPVQRIHDDFDFKIEKFDIKINQSEVKVELEDGDEEGTRGLAPLSNDLAARNPQPVTALISSFVRPFDLSQAPLLRVGLIKPPHTPSALRGHPSQEGRENKYLLIMDMHHIISDGVSHQVLLNDFMALYEDKAPPPLRIQYKDFTRWQNSEKEKENLKRQEQYWLKEFSAEIPVLHLPTDYTRPMVQSFEGDDVKFKLQAGTTRALKAIALEANATMYMVLLAVFNILLSNLSSQEDIVIGTPIAGRRHADLEPIMGMFVNTLALRSCPRGEKTFNAFLAEVKDKTLQAFENQEYQFEDLVEKVSVARDASRNPLFDVMFALQNFDANARGESSRESAAVQWELQEQPEQQQDNQQKIFRVAKFDMTLTCVEQSESLSFTVEYCTKLFKKQTIERFIDYFKNIVSMVVKEPGMNIRQIELIPGDEKKQVLYDFNDTKVVFPGDKTIHELFEKQVEKKPDNIAVVGPLPVKHRTYMTHMTYTSYRELNEKSYRLAYLLKEKGIQPDTIVGIMMGRSIEMIIGILGLLKAGGAYLPIDPDYPEDRITYMLADSKAKMLVTTRSLSPKAAFKKDIVYLEGDKELPPNTNLDQPAADSRQPPTSLAYVLYTSGSTGKPKGVMIEHRSVVNRINWMQSEYPIAAGDVILQKTPFTFDVSVWELSWWFFRGASLRLLGPGEEKDPEAIVKAIEESHITVIHFVPSMLNTFLEYVGDPETRHLKALASLKQVFSSGETLTVHLLERFNTLLYQVNNTKLANLYGPTEATVDVSYFNCPPGEKLTKVPIGKPIDNIHLYVVDSKIRLQPIGVTGELCISGIGLARGYLNNPGLTAEKFDHDLWDYLDYQDEKQKVPGKNERQSCSHAAMQYHPPFPHFPIYRTGDLARWLPEGNIEFLGRLDHQVKIRGFRIELGEIENQLLKKEEIKEAVVLDRGSENGDKFLCAYIVWKSTTLEAAQLRGYLSRSLPDYMIPAYFIRIDKIPLTANGKIDRSALPAAEVKSRAQYAAPRNTTEARLIDIWRHVLGVYAANEADAAPAKNVLIGIHDNFFELGGHSLKATIMVSKIHKALHVKVPLAVVFKTPTIRQLAEYITHTAKEKYNPIEPVETKEYYPLSSAQKRLYILQQMELDNTAYNMPEIIPLAEEPTIEKLHHTFIKLITRHESLRTSLHMIHEVPVQQVHDEVEFEIEYCLASDFVRPFDLSKAPLLRVGLVKTNHNQHLLLVDMHHIISDGVSHELLKQDFMALHQNQQLKPLPIQYKDFAEWQHSEKETETLKQQEAYWLKEFSAEIPVLHLPTDYSMTIVQDFEGDNVEFNLLTNTARALKTIALEANVTMYMVLLAVFNILLSKLSSQEDIVIGTPIAGRRHADLEPIIGMFVNTLALRNYPRGEQTFNTFLADVKEKTLQAFENQEYQFEDLVEKAEVRRDITRNPLFDVMFTFQNIDTGDRGDIKQTGQTGKTGKEKPAVTYRQEDENLFRTSKFDITLVCAELDQRLFFTLVYCTKLYKKESIQRFIGYFKKILSLIVENPRMKLCQIEIISEEEKKQVLYDFNDTEADYPKNKTIHQLFEEQVEKKPDHIAVLGISPAAGRTTHAQSGTRFIVSVCCSELNKRSQHLANLIRNKAIGPDDIVAIMIEPSTDMMVGIMAVLKAGACYLPIDPINPVERISYMLNDSETKLLLTGKHPTVKEGFAGETLNINDENLYPGDHEVSETHRFGETVYMIYTSGTTGNPKGVQVKHENLVNYTTWFAAAACITREDKTVLTSSFSFDLGYTSTYPSLLTGAQLHIISRETYMIPERLLNYISMQGITYLKMTPSLFSTLVADTHFFKETCPGLRLVVLGGEPINTADVEKAYQACQHLRIMNHYGPTEVTIGCIARFINIRELETYKTRPTIGKPIFNTRAYILDKYFNLLPVGITGELCLSGSSVAKGYFKQEALTLEKFIELKKVKIIASLLDSPETLSKPEYTRIYRTGDLARWLPDGNIEFLGRLDHQVKIRGFRIEPGEIENRLLKKEEIKEAVVLDRESENGDKYLCAYIVWKSTSLETAKLRKYLSRSLPDYMVPSYFVEIEKIPLTPNGKIDRSTLPIPQLEETRESFLAPNTLKDVLEQKLVEIWTEILAIDIERIGLTTNFFHLGGHSLKATIMAEKIKKELNVNMPLIEVFKTPTIKQLAEYIRTTEKEIFAFQDNNLVLIKKGVEKDHHLFFVHDATGEVDRFIKFCNYLKIGFNCWGLRADRLENYIPLNISLKDIAKKYIKKIKKVQPPGHGPYHIAGWSMGGLIAFEMARQLEKEKEKVAFLGLIDSRTPSLLLGIAGWFTPHKFNLHSELKFLKRLFAAEDRIEKRSKKVKKFENFWPEIVDYLETGGFDKKTIKRKILKFGRHILPNFQRLNVSQCIYYLNQGRTFTRALDNYIPFGKIKNTPLHFFKANQSWHLEGKYWEKYTDAPVQLYEIPGDHFSIFIEHIGELVKSFNKALCIGNSTKC